MTMKILKKLFSAKDTLDPLETALLNSLGTEPEHWEFVEKDGLIARHRGKGIVVRSSRCWLEGRAQDYGAQSDKLVYSEAFAKTWHTQAVTIAGKRKSDADAASAATTKVQISRALGL